MTQGVPVEIVARNLEQEYSVLPPAISLNRVLNTIPVLTHATAVLGVGTDCVPILWDAQGGKNLLVIGEGLILPWQVLDAARVSLAQNNTRHLVELTWVTARERPGEYGSTTVVSPYERTLEQTLRRLADLVDRRQHGQNRGAVQVLILDDLAQVLKADYEARWALEFVLERGAGVGVQALAAVDSSTLTRRPVKGWDGRFGLVLRQREGEAVFATPRGALMPVEV